MTTVDPSADRMLIDWHMHVWLPEQLGKQWIPPLERRYKGITRAACFERTDEARADAGLQAAVIIGLNCHHTEVVIPNEFIAEYVEPRRHDTIGFACVDPTDPDAPAKLRYAAADLGLKGVKFAPPYQNFHPHDPRAWTLYHLANELGLVVMFHQGASFVPRGALEYSSPVLLDAIARELPDLPLIVAHVGHPWFPETIALLYKHANVYADISARCQRTWQLYNILRTAEDYDVTHRLLFGSDFPITTPKRSLEGLLGLNEAFGGKLPPFDRRTLEDIAFRRPLSALGLELDVPYAKDMQLDAEGMS